jgi:murein DD-endopeptidase MepM/ murein hydrolase activator NlpD
MGLLGCGKPPWSPSAVPTDEYASASQNIALASEVEESPTAVVSVSTIPEPSADPAVTPAASAPLPKSDPLRFTFPTNEPPPVSAWRPPLYPTPWAISPYDHFYFARPIAADEVNWPLWDYRYGGVFFENVVHTGIDITAPKGTPVLAAGPGKVVWAGYGLYSRTMDDWSDPYGLAVAIHHDFGYEGQDLYTIYGHLNEIDVAEGQWVDVGEMLGRSGETGKVTGPHLHFEVRLGSNSFYTTRNPELWLSPPQGWGVLAGLVTNSGGLWANGQEVVIHSKDTGQTWLAKTYGADSANSDAYYQENIVVGDLPAGRYEVSIPYAGYNNTLEVDLKPGMVTYFSFRGFKWFTAGLPAAPGADFTPAPYETPTVEAGKP